MSEATRHCPECDEERTFWLTARTNVGLGRKEKWRCAECGHGFVQIDEAVDTSATA